MATTPRSSNGVADPGRRRALGAVLAAACAALIPGAARAAPRAPSGGRLYAATGTIQVAFTPGDPVDDIIVAAIGEARRQVLVQAFAFTHRRIARALIAAHRRGVEVQVIADDAQDRRLKTSVLAHLARAGVPVFLDSDRSTAHNKVMVIDAGTPAATVITGSYNFTHAAQHRNTENIVVFRGNPPLAEAFVQNWNRQRAHVLPYRERPRLAH
jgi:phosphatidylserine/phosphatidylglycerophosphate/cardiolipin synthase-like enzyme